MYDNLSTEQIHAIFKRICGPRDWDPFSKAKYLNQLYNKDKYPMSLIVSLCGGKSAEIKKLIDAYSDMVSHYVPQVEAQGMDFDPREFSKFAELQNYSIREAIAVHRYTKNDFAKWVISGNIDNAQNVRHLPKVLANNAAKEIFLKKNITEAVKVLHVEVKHETDLTKATIDELVLVLTQKLRAIEYSTVKALRDNPDYNEQKNNIYTLLDEINNLIPDIKGEQE